MSEEPSLAGQSTSQTQTSQSNGSAPAGGANLNNGGSQGADTQNGHVVTQADMAKIFGEDFTKDPSLSKFKTPGDVMKSYKELQSQIGKPRFDIPGQDAPPEQVADFYKKLGVPDNSEGYDLKPDANVPEHNNETNAEFLRAFSDVAHELKLTTAQAGGIQKFFDDITVALNEEQSAAIIESDRQLDEMLGKALGEDKNVASERIRQTLERVLPQELREALSDKVSNEALLAIAMLDKHYQSTYGRSDQNVGDHGRQAGRSLVDMQTEAKELYKQIMKDGLMAPSYKANWDRLQGMYKTIGELSAAQKSQ